MEARQQAAALRGNGMGERWDDEEWTRAMYEAAICMARNDYKSAKAALDRAYAARDQRLPPPPGAEVGRR